MLIDVKLTAMPDPLASVVAAINGRPWPPTRLALGLWQWGHWNPEFEIEGGRDGLERYPDLGEAYAYGVCDSLLALSEHPLYKAVLADPARRFTVIGVELRREDQSPDGGWRWHKWGPYVGEQEPRHEYLYDDTHIDVVWTFHVYEHKRHSERAC